MRCANRRWIQALAVVVAGTGVAGQASARCVLPAEVSGDAQLAAIYLHDSMPIIADGIVHELPRGDGTLFQRIEIIQYLKGKGPAAIDIWPGPGKPTRHDIINDDTWGRIDAPDGARVVTALKESPFGWTIGECAYQALVVPGVEDALRTGRWAVKAGK